MKRVLLALPFFATSIHMSVAASSCVSKGTRQTPSPNSASRTEMLLHHPAGCNYFVNGAGHAVLLRGDNTWEDNALNGVFDFSRYLNFLSQQGSNYVRMWAPNPQIHSNLVEEPDGISPFQKTADGKWDLTQYNPAYFDNLKAQVRAAAARGIYVSDQLVFDYDPGGQYHIWTKDYWNGNNNVNGTTSDDIVVEDASH